jgi:hypothetical protein
MRQPNTLSVNQFLAVPEHPPYSPDLAPCDFHLFPKIKSVFKGAHFASVEHVKAKTAEILNSLTEHDLPTQKRTILKAIVVDFLNLLNRKSYTHSIVFFVSDHIYFLSSGDFEQ